MPVASCNTALTAASDSAPLAPCGSSQGQGFLDAGTWECGAGGEPTSQPRCPGHSPPHKE